MPIYHYQCLDCRSGDTRIAGLDDHEALCTDCGGLMLRLDEDIFRPYFDAGMAPAQERRISGVAPEWLVKSN